MLTGIKLLLESEDRQAEFPGNDGLARAQPGRGAPQPLPSLSGFLPPPTPRVPGGPCDPGAAHRAGIDRGAGPRPQNPAPWGSGAREPSWQLSCPTRGWCRLSGGGKGHKSGNKKKKFLHIFKTHVALSEVLFILTKSGGTCPHSGEADGTINHGRRCRPAAHSPQLSLFCLFGFS